METNYEKARDELVHKLATSIEPYYSTEIAMCKTACDFGYKFAQEKYEGEIKYLKEEIHEPEYYKSKLLAAEKEVECGLRIIRDMESTMWREAEMSFKKDAIITKLSKALDAIVRSEVVRSAQHITYSEAYLNAVEALKEFGDKK